MAGMGRWVVVRRRRRLCPPAAFGGWRRRRRRLVTGRRRRRDFIVFRFAIPGLRLAARRRLVVGPFPWAGVLLLVRLDTIL